MALTIFSMINMQHQNISYNKIIIPGMKTLMCCMQTNQQEQDTVRLNNSLATEQRNLKLLMTSTCSLKDSLRDIQNSKTERFSSQARATQDTLSLPLQDMCKLKIILSSILLELLLAMDGWIPFTSTLVTQNMLLNIN